VVTREGEGGSGGGGRGEEDGRSEKLWTRRLRTTRYGRLFPAFSPSSTRATMHALGRRLPRSGKELVSYSCTRASGNVRACLHTTPSPVHTVQPARSALPLVRSRALHTVPPRHEASRPLPLSAAQRQTIFALASAPGRAGVAVIRVSGPDVRDVCARVLRRVNDPTTPLPPLQPRMMSRCAVVHPESGEVLDDGLAVLFPGARAPTAPRPPLTARVA
jgi:hypothetical protein